MPIKQMVIELVISTLGSLLASLILATLTR